MQEAGNATGVGGSLVSHHHAAAPAPSCTLPAASCACTLRVLSRLARFTLCHPRPESLSRGFVIRAIGEAAPPSSCRTRRAYQAIR